MVKNYYDVINDNIETSADEGLILTSLRPEEDPSTDVPNSFILSEIYSLSNKDIKDIEYGSISNIPGEFNIRQIKETKDPKKDLEFFKGDFKLNLNTINDKSLWVSTIEQYIMDDGYAIYDTHTNSYLISYGVYVMVPMYNTIVIDDMIFISDPKGLHSVKSPDHSFKGTLTSGNHIVLSINDLYFMLSEIDIVELMRTSVVHFIHNNVGYTAEYNGDTRAVNIVGDIDVDYIIEYYKANYKQDVYKWTPDVVEWFEELNIPQLSLTPKSKTLTIDVERPIRVDDKAFIDYDIKTDVPYIINSDMICKNSILEQIIKNKDLKREFNRGINGLSPSNEKIRGLLTKVIERQPVELVVRESKKSNMFSHIPSVIEYEGMHDKTFIDELIKENKALRTVTKELEGKLTGLLNSPEEIFEVGVIEDPNKPIEKRPPRKSKLKEKYMPIAPIETREANSDVYNEPMYTVLRDKIKSRRSSMKIISDIDKYINPSLIYNYYWYNKSYRYIYDELINNGYNWEWDRFKIEFRRIDYFISTPPNNKNMFILKLSQVLETSQLIPHMISSKILEIGEL